MKTLLLTTALLSYLKYAVAQSCTIPAATCNTNTYTYAAEPCFPNTGVCYPTNYYAAQDQGQFSGANGPFASQLNAKCQAICDGNSQCLSYVGVINKAADGNLATGTCFFYSVQQVYPRQCADAPSGIVAYYKQKVCPTTTTSSSSTTKSTTTSSSTTKSTTTSSTTTKSTTTSSTTTKSTTTSSSTTKSTTTSSSTTKSTTTSSTTSSSTTSSSTTSSSTTSSSTSSSTTSSSTTTSSTTTTSSSTTTSSTTTSTSAAATPAFVPCNGPPYGNDAGTGAGGCPSSCYCDHDVSGGGFCENATGCGNTCATDADCPSGTKCTDTYLGQCGGNTCLDSSSCVGQTKRSLLMRGDEGWRYFESMKMASKKRDPAVGGLHPKIGGH